MSEQLQTIVQDSGLEPSKAKFILEQFTEFFTVAEEWEAKAKSIVVTDATQQALMATAREGRLVLKSKRIAIEKTRKELKEQALREGKAIDGIANILKAIIAPLEKHLDQQEHFVEIKAQEAADRERQRIEAEAQVKREAEERAQREEQERIRQENIKLKREAEEREAKAKAEMMRLEAEKRAVEERAKKDREEAEAKARAERERVEKEKREAEAKARREREVARRKAEARMETERKERAAVEARLAAEVECPACHHRFIPTKTEPSNSK